MSYVPQLWEGKDKADTQELDNRSLEIRDLVVIGDFRI